MTLLRQQKGELLSAKYRMATAVGVLGYTAPAVPVPWGTPHSAAKPDAVPGASGLFGLGGFTPHFTPKYFFLSSFSSKFLPHLYASFPIGEEHGYSSLLAMEMTVQKGQFRQVCFAQSTRFTPKHLLNKQTCCLCLSTRERLYKGRVKDTASHFEHV